MKTYWLHLSNMLTWFWVFFTGVYLFTVATISIGKGFESDFTSTITYGDLFIGYFVIGLCFTPLLLLIALINTLVLGNKTK